MLKGETGNMTEEQLFVEIIKDTVTAWNQGTYNERFMLLSVVIAALIVALVCTVALCIGQGKKRTPIRNFIGCFASIIYTILAFVWISYGEPSGMTGRLEYYLLFLILDVWCIRHTVYMAVQTKILYKTLRQHCKEAVSS